LSAAYIKLLKARTNCNIVGFYILGNREFSDQLGYFMDKNFQYPHKDYYDKIDAMKVGIDSAKHQAQLAQQAKQASMNTLTDIGKHKAELEMQKRQAALQHIQQFKRDEKPPKEPKA
jgi:hypothetical protein